MKFQVMQGDALSMLRTLPDKSVNCCVTSPPYWGLRDYGMEDQLGLESTPTAYVDRLVGIFQEVRRVLRDDGTLWLNLGDSYASGGNGFGTPDCKQRTNPGSHLPPKFAPEGLKPKDLVGIPWKVAFALQEAGWYLRSDIIWHKPNPMPESVTDRPTKSHEYLFLLSKSERYYYDADAIAEDVKPISIARVQQPNYDNQIGSHRVHGMMMKAKTMKAVLAEGNEYKRNKRSVWTVATKPYAEAHFATFPPKLIQPCILAGCPENGTVIDPFVGSGTTLWVANSLCRNAIGIELNPKYVALIEKRMSQGFLDMFTDNPEEPKVDPVEWDIQGEEDGFAERDGVRR